MVAGVDQARQQRELSKQQLAADAARVQSRIRSELDWRARLRRDGPRLVAIGAGAVVLVTAIAVVRSRFRRSPKAEPVTATSLEDVAVELAEIRKRLDKRGEGGAVWQKALLRGVAAAGAAGGTYAAKRFAGQQASSARGGAEAAGVS